MLSERSKKNNRCFIGVKWICSSGSSSDSHLCVLLIRGQSCFETRLLRFLRYISQPNSAPFLVHESTSLLVYINARLPVAMCTHLLGNRLMCDTYLPIRIDREIICRVREIKIPARVNWWVDWLDRVGCDGDASVQNQRRDRSLAWLADRERWRWQTCSSNREII